MISCCGPPRLYWENDSVDRCQFVSGAGSCKLSWKDGSEAVIAAATEVATVVVA